MIQKTNGGVVSEFSRPEIMCPSELRTLTDHSAAVNAVAVTPDGQRALSASDDQTLKVWDQASGRELRTFTGHLERC